MDSVTFALSAVSTILYLASLATMRPHRARLAWALTLASLIPTVAVVVLAGAYPSLVGCVVGAAIAIQRIRE